MHYPITIAWVTWTECRRQKGQSQAGSKGQNLAQLGYQQEVGRPEGRVQRVGVFNFGTDRVRVLEKTSGSGTGTDRVRVLALHFYQSAL